MLRKKLSTIVCAVLLVITCIGLVACGNNDGGETLKPLHDSSKWFTEEELSAKGLTGLPVPTGLSGEINSSDAWYNDGYSFSQFARTKQRSMRMRRHIFRILKLIMTECSASREAKNSA